MHELGVAAGIIDIVRQYVPPEQGARVKRVHVRVGDVAGVMVDSLAWCFEVSVSGTPYASAVLVVERVPGSELRVADLEVEDEEDETP